MLSDPRRLAQRWNRRYGAGSVVSKAGKLKAPKLGKRDWRVRQRAKTDHATAQALADYPMVMSLPYRKATVQHCTYERSDARVVAFGVAFMRLLRGYGIPLTPLWYSTTCVEFWHFSRGYDLTNREWRVIATIAEEAARKVHQEMHWCGDDTPYNPVRWELTPGDAELYMPWRPDRDA